MERHQQAESGFRAYAWYCQRTYLRHRRDANFTHHTFIAPGDANLRVLVGSQGRNFHEGEAKPKKDLPADTTTGSA